MAVCGSGCALLIPQSAVDRITAERPFLPPINNDRNVVNLEVYFVERVIGDPTISDALWRSVNQADGSPSTHARLRAAGIQYGVAPSSPPPGLQALIGKGNVKSQTRQTSVVHVPLLNGTPTPLPVCTLPEGSMIPSSGKDRGQPVRISNGRCSFRVSAEPLQTGWVKVNFIPEIHHGTEQMQRVATEQRWEPRFGQQVESYYDQEFSLDLNTGEFVVVGLHGEQPNSLGHLFFRDSEAQGQFQRVMIVRVGGTQQMTPLRSSKGTF